MKALHKMDQRFQQIVADYRRKDHNSAGLACANILEGDANNVEALFLFGLCHCNAGSAEIGASAINKALSLKPELSNYDFLRDLLIQQDLGNQNNFWETLFFQYLLFQDVDAFLLSNPKCGRTWLRALLGKYVIGEDKEADPLNVLSLTQKDPNFCSLEVTHDDYPHWKPAEKIFTNKQAYADKKVIFLVRDPRDVLVSYYFQYTKRGDKKLANDADFHGDLSEFIRHRIGGLGSLVSFYNVWAENRDLSEAFLLVSYEDMSTDTKKVLMDVIGFLDWPERNANFIDEVIDYGRFDNMRRLEETNVLNNIRLKPPEDGDPEGFKIRRGKVGGYSDYLTEYDVAYINAYLAENLHDLFKRYK